LWRARPPPSSPWGHRVAGRGFQQAPYREALSGTQLSFRSALGFISPGNISSQVLCLSSLGKPDP
jgi:hypothetical protein